MTDFQKLTFHPLKHKMRNALWMSNYFGASLWGIRFMGEEKVYRVHEINQAHQEFGVVTEIEEDEDESTVY